MSDNRFPEDRWSKTALLTLESVYLDHAATARHQVYAFCGECMLTSSISGNIFGTSLDV